MNFIFVGLLVSLMAWLINRRFFLNLGATGVIVAAPILEEVLKTGGAILFGSDLILVHACFGTVEAVLDINTGSHSKIGGILSFLGHLSFGYLTALLYAGGNLWWALSGGIGAHIIWNTFIVFIMSQRKKGDFR